MAEVKVNIPHQSQVTPQATLSDQEISGLEQECADAHREICRGDALVVAGEEMRVRGHAIKSIGEQNHAKLSARLKAAYASRGFDKQPDPNPSPVVIATPQAGNE